MNLTKLISKDAGKIRRDFFPYFIIISFIFFAFEDLIYSQEIHIRTVPLAAGNQSGFQPSNSLGMGNLSIAFNDTLLEPFVNPAKAARINGLSLFFSPTRNSWSNKNGTSVSTISGSAKYSGTVINSIPFGVFIKKNNIFAGGLITYQSYSSKRTILRSLIHDIGFWQSNSNKNDIGDNTYIYGLLGTDFPELKLSIAGSISWSDYNAIDGVNLLYPGSLDIIQNGFSINYKLGLTTEISENGQLDFVLGRSIFKSTHEVIYGAGGWIDDSWSSPYRTEFNKDESKGWVIHTKYNLKLDEEWILGTIFTLNWKEHPKIPNYSLANIPRDPGTSTAYNIGVGFTNSGKRTTLGLEYIYEPITSYTWADAGENNIHPPSFKTVENFFDFDNHIIRAGLTTHTDYSWLDYRLGVQLHFYNYDLKQDNNLQFTSRNADENWLETTLSGGLTVKFSNFQMLYTLQIILGNGMVGVNSWTTTNVRMDASYADFLIAPSGNLVVETIPLITQQISFVYNL